MDLKCKPYGFEAGFSLVGLSVKPKPYSMRFAGADDCGSFNAGSSDHIYGGICDFFWKSFDDASQIS